MVFSEFISSFKLTDGVAEISRVGLAFGKFQMACHRSLIFVTGKSGVWTVF